MIKKFFTVLISICCLNGCVYSRVEETKQNCIYSWAFYESKITSLTKQIKDMGELDDFVVLKQGASGAGPLYWFILIGIKDGHGIIVHTNSYMTKSLITSTQLGVAERFITIGKSIVDSDFERQVNLDTRPIVCHFINYKDSSEKNGFFMPGMLIDKVDIDGFVQELRGLSMESSDKNRLLNPDPTRSITKEQAETFYQKIKNDHFIEIR